MATKKCSTAYIIALKCVRIPLSVPVYRTEHKIDTWDHFMIYVMLVLSPINKSTRDKLNYLKFLYSYGLSF